MTLTFRARIDGRQIRCEIGTDRALAAPVFCFSLMAAPAVVAGGTLVRRVAGYAEVALPDLAAGAVHEVVLEHADPRFLPRNRAWLPLGPYLRVGRQCLPLPPGIDLGLRDGDAPPAAPLAPDRLPLVPQPTEWRMSGETLSFTALAPVAGLEGADELAVRLGLAPLVAAGGAALAVSEDARLGAESYRLVLAPEGLSVAIGGRACTMPQSRFSACGQPWAASCPAARSPTSRALAGAASILIAHDISSGSTSYCGSWT